MARKQDVAGLAALAGLGMLMANRKKGGEGGVSPRQMAADREASEMPEAAAEEDPMEAANKRTDRMLMPNQRGDAGTSETMFPSGKPAVGGARPTLKPMAERYQPAADRPNQNYSNEARNAPRPNENYGNEGRQAPVGRAGLDTAGMNQRAQKALSDDPLALAGAATGVAAAGLKAKKAYDTYKAGKAAGEVASAGREAVTNPLMWAAGPKNMSKFTGEVPSAGREAVTNPMAWMGGPKNMSKFEEAAPSAIDKAKEAALKFADRFKKKPLSEADTTGGAGKYGYKKGGKVKGYASGGSVSSASRRGDGIATKGKTRGKIC